MKHSWENLDNIQMLSDIRKKSFDKPQLIFKHSTTCSISAIAKRRLDQDIDELESRYDCYYLDLLRHRNISNTIADDFDVVHESPQVIIIHKGEASYDESHLDISVNDISSHMQFLNI